MATPMISKVQFMDGAAVEDVVRIFIAGDLQSGNYNLSRLFYLRDEDEWGHFDVETIVVSVCVLTKPRRKYFALGRDGLIWSIETGGNPILERISDAGTGKGKFGYLTQIRTIGDRVYACGDGGQVYQHTATGWTHMDDGILDRTPNNTGNCHNGIDGTGPSDIYVVGEYGRIFHFDGQKWTRIDCQTNLNLERVRCVSSDEVYVCGERGILLRGNRRGWDVIDTELTDNLWDLEMFKGRLYLAAEDRLMYYDGHAIELVDTGLEPQIDAHRLSARNNILWSFGEDDLAYYDGKKWTRVVHPDNV
jgi:hypothetical protein